MSIPYLIASLPTLALDAPPPLTVAEFREACGRVLSPPAATTVAALLDGQPCEHPFVAGWRDRETQLRNAVARRRAARNSQDPGLFQRPVTGCDLRLAQGVEAAFEQPDPLRREQALERLCWSVLDELQGPQPHSFEVLLAYAVRLQLTVRAAQREAEAGRARIVQLTALGGATAALVDASDANRGAEPKA